MNRLAFVAQGRLFLHDAQGAREIASRFGENIRRRAVAARERHAWKAEGAGARFAGVWGRQPEDDPAEMPIDIISVTRGATAAELLYTLQTPDLCAALRLEDSGEHEQRLWHSAETSIRDLARHPTEPRVACSVQSRAGIANIGVMKADGSGLGQVTEGDSVDLAPRWVPGAAGVVVFQSAGIGRNRDGAAVGYGPFHVQRLEVETGALETIAEEPGFDLLAPQGDAQGRLHFIRRPYQLPYSRSWWRTGLDILLLPVRLLQAIFGFVNVFSMMFGGQPLISAGGPRREHDPRGMMLWGKYIDAQKALRKGKADEAPDMVPRTWELVRRELDGRDTVLARSVLSYDLRADGAILYSNGSAIYLRTPDDRTETLLKHHFIEQVTALAGDEGPATA